MTIRFDPSDPHAERKARTYAKYKALADAGLTTAQAAAALRVVPSAVTNKARQYGLEFADGRIARLTDAQKRDMATLVEMGGYTHAEALRAVTAPKRRVTWRAK